MNPLDPPLSPRSFSARTAWDTTETRLAKALRRAKQSGRPLLDLTASNPTRCGFDYDAEALLAPLSNPAALDYDPNPRGMHSAREAVCRYYQDHSADIAPGQIFLTVSTSEAYSFLLRLLCDVGDEVLIAEPGYPLLDFLATLDDVRRVPHAMIYDHGWQIDPPAILARITPRTKAIAVVNPNNPTGNFIKPWERKALEEICMEYGLALIVDEVFLDYPLQRGAESRVPSPSFAHGENPVLTFVLSGLSKIAALPQMKAAWIACLGPRADQQQALDRLEIVADTFLSINAPVQCALPHWLRTRQGMQTQILGRLKQNLATLDELLATQTLISRLVVEGGWYTVLRIPALFPDEETCMALLEENISVHPGYLFGLSSSGWLVVSLLGASDDFASGIRGIFALIQGESR